MQSLDEITRCFVTLSNQYLRTLYQYFKFVVTVNSYLLECWFFKVMIYKLSTKLLDVFVALSCNGLKSIMPVNMRLDLPMRCRLVLGFCSALLS